MKPHVTRPLKIRAGCYQVGEFTVERKMSGNGWVVHIDKRVVIPSMRSLEVCHEYLRSFAATPTDYVFTLEKYRTAKFPPLKLVT